MLSHNQPKGFPIFLIYPTIMKLFTTLLLLFSILPAFSQHVHWNYIDDSVAVVQGDTDVYFDSEYVNDADTAIDLRWRVMSFSSPDPSWDAHMFDIICWPSISEVWTADVPMPANSTILSVPVIHVKEGSGTSVLQVCVFDVTDSAGTRVCRSFTAIVEDTTTTDTTQTDTSASDPLLGLRNPLKKSSLAQNSPNPFFESTQIKYELPGAKGVMRIHDLHGKLVEERILAKSAGVITVGDGLEAGMYVYSLWSNGVKLDSKRMILSR